MEAAKRRTTGAKRARALADQWAADLEAKLREVKMRLA